MIVRRLGRGGEARVEEANKTTFLINIGTHKKPGSEEERDILEESLSDAIRRVLTSGNFQNQCLYPVVVERGNPKGRRVIQSLTLDANRTDDALGFVGHRADYAIERGAVTDRVDAHIIYHVLHRRPIRFDHKRLQVLLDDELERENERFRQTGVLDSSGVGHLRWANPRLYTSFNRIGFDTTREAVEYIQKYTKMSERDRERFAIQLGTPGGDGVLSKNLGVTRLTG